MHTEQDLLEMLNRQFPGMSKAQKRIASYLMENCEKAAFLTAAALAKETMVSESTVVRFAASLGYDGFIPFHKALGQMVEKRLSSVHKIEFSKKTSTRAELVRAVLQSDHAKLEELQKRLDPAALDIAVENILQAKTIYIIGLRNCAPLAQCLYFHLNVICPSIVLLQSTSSSELFEQMMRIDEKDVLIGISFPRYSMRTLKAMEFACDRNAKIITITDSMYSPMNLYSSCNLLAKSELSSVLGSLVAPFSLINALVMALYMEKEEEVLRNMELLETLWEDYQTYSKDEIDFFDPQKGADLNG